MSAFGIGIRRNEAEDFGAAPAPTNAKEQIASVFAKYVKWIPADVVAGYSAFVAANWIDQTQKFAKTPPGPTPAPDARLWWVGLIFCPVIVIVGAFLVSNWPKLVRRSAFAAVGFVVWTASIPHSIWEQADWFVDLHVGVHGLALVLAGGLIAAIGEKLLDFGVWGTGWKQLL